MAKSRQSRRVVVYRDRKTGRLVSESTWRRSKARGGTRYVRQRVQTRRQLGRAIYVLGFDGYVPVTVRSSKEAKLASRHLNAVSRFLRTGDTEALKPFVRKRIARVELLTDPGRLRELANAGLLFKLDGLYRQNRSGRHNR